MRSASATRPPPMRESQPAAHLRTPTPPHMIQCRLRDRQNPAGFRSLDSPLRECGDVRMRRQLRVSAHRFGCLCGEHGFGRSRGEKFSQPAAHQCLTSLDFARVRDIPASPAPSVPRRTRPCPGANQSRCPNLSRSSGVGPSVWSGHPMRMCPLRGTRSPSACKCGELHGSASLRRTYARRRILTDCAGSNVSWSPDRRAGITSPRSLSASSANSLSHRRMRGPGSSAAARNGQPTRRALAVAQRRKRINRRSAIATLQVPPLHIRADILTEEPIPAVEVEPHTLTTECLAVLAEFLAVIPLAPASCSLIMLSEHDASVLDVHHSVQDRYGSSYP